MVIKNSLIYIFSSAFSKAVPFLLLPLFTTLLVPEEFGLFSIYQVLLVFFTAFIGMSLQTNITVNFFKVDKEELAAYFNNVLFVLVINVILFFIIFYIFNCYKNSFFSIDFSYLYFLLPIVFFTVIIEIYSSLLRNQQKASSFFFVEVFGTVLKYILILFFLIFLKQGWISFLYGNLIGLGLIAIYSFYSLIKQKFINFKLGLNITKIKEILKLCIPLIPHTVGIMVIALTDRLFIEKLISIEAVGIYTVAYSFGVIVSLFSDAFIKAWSPWFYSKIKELNEQDAKKIVAMTYLYIIGIIILSVLVYFIAYFLIPLMTSNEYHEAINYVFYIALGYSIQGIYKIFFPYLIYFSKTQVLTLSTFIAACVSLIGNSFLINLFGVVGAAYSSILAFFVSSMFVFYIANKQIKLPWFFSKWF